MLFVIGKEQIVQLDCLNRSYFPHLLELGFCNFRAIMSCWKCWIFDSNKAITVSHGTPVSWCRGRIILFVSDDATGSCDTRAELLGQFIFILRLLPDISLPPDSHLSMICPLPEKFLTRFDMNRKFAGDPVSHQPGPGREVKPSRVPSCCQPPPSAFEISDEQISGLRNMFCGLTIQWLVGVNWQEAASYLISVKSVRTRGKYQFCLLKHWNFSYLPVM